MHRVSFRIHYCTDPSQRLVLCGSLPELGSWNLSNALEMQWTEGHIWQAHTTLSSPVFSYKYVVLQNNNASWEKGINRHADLTKLTTRTLEDLWEGFKIHFRLYCPVDSETKVVKIIGEPAELGAWGNTDPPTMKLGEPKLIPTGVQTPCWEATVAFNKFINQRGFQYKYMIYDTRYLTGSLERGPNRRADVRYAQESGQDHDNNMINSEMEILDMNFVNTFEIYRMHEVPIFIGPCITNLEDIGKLENAGINAVLSIQTDKDLLQNHINLDFISKSLQEVDIVMERYPIIDFSAADLRNKIRGAAAVLDNLISQSKTVYVHCTAGIGRAPAVVVGYLVEFDGYSVDSALNHVRSGCDKIVPNESVLREVYNR